MELINILISALVSFVVAIYTAKIQARTEFKKIRFTNYYDHLKELVDAIGKYKASKRNILFKNLPSKKDMKYISEVNDYKKKMAVLPQLRSFLVNEIIPLIRRKEGFIRDPKLKKLFNEILKMRDSMSNKYNVYGEIKSNEEELQILEAMDRKIEDISDYLSKLFFSLRNKEVS